MKTIICYGDSNTYGYDPASFVSGRYPEGVRWTSILDEMPEYTIENYGMNGRSIPHTKNGIQLFRDMLKKWECMEEPTLLIMLGTNDLLQNRSYSAEDVTKRMETFLTETIQGVEKMKIFLIAPPLMEYGSWVEEERIYQESRRLGVCYQKLAKQLELRFIDMSKHHIPVIFDGVHLSEDGHREFAEVIKKALA